MKFLAIIFMLFVFMHIVNALVPYVSRCTKKAEAAKLEIDLDIIATIESSNNPMAYNIDSEATGMFQITPICLRDFNQCNKSELRIHDMYSPANAWHVADWYLHTRIPQLLKHYKKELTLENVLIAYNAGISRVGSEKIPNETKEYIRKYKSLMDSKQWFERQRTKSLKAVQ